MARPRSAPTPRRTRSRTSSADLSLSRRPARRAVPRGGRRALAPDALRDGGESAVRRASRPDADPPDNDDGKATGNPPASPARAGRGRRCRRAAACPPCPPPAPRAARRSAAPSRARPRQRGAQLVVAHDPLRRARLRDAVGVEHERVAGAAARRARRAAPGRARARAACPARPTSSTVPSARRSSAGRMPAARDRRADRRPRRVEVHAGDRAEAAVEVLAAASRR